VAACELVARARPDAAREVRRLGAEPEARRPAPAESALLHGDPHPKNALVTEGRVTFVDLDQAAAGPRAADLGSVLAALRYGRCVGGLTAGHARALEVALLAGYGDLPARDELVWHTAAALLVERAARAVHRVRLPGLLRLDALLADARELLA
jgi:Ser/Thr protein kinase RdoA (MazF antagonist)